MLKLILGRAKSGKTAAIMEEIHRRVLSRSGGSVLLVPEQYSHEAERELLRFCGDSLSLYARVLSFSRLASAVAGETGGAGTPPLDPGGRLLCLVLALDAVGSRLKLFSGARRQAELQQSLLSAIDEFKTCRISPEQLSNFAGRRGDSLGEKLNDLALIYSAYNAVAARSGLDPMDALDSLADDLGRSSYAMGSFYIDGFIDFTAQEERVIEAMLRSGCAVTVCLGCEGLEEGHDIFEPSRRAAARLCRLARGLGQELEISYMSDERSDGPMAFIERELFSFKNVRADAGGAVTLVSAPGLSEEIEAAAARCLELVRSGCRWRDIAVAARDYEGCRAGVESIFRHYGIPLYSARRSDLMEKPLPALIASAYGIINGGWDYEDVFTYLKTGLAGLNMDECDELENYVFLWSLRGSSWTRDADWTAHPEGYGGDYDDAARKKLERINYLRRRASAPLLAFARAAAGAVTAREQAAALGDFLTRLNLAGSLDERSRALESAGMAQTGAEYAQLWEVCLRALEQCAAILGDTEMDCESFGRLYCTVLSRYDVGTIPLSLDRVSAGSMDRMRRRHIKHLILLGCDSGALPRAEAPGGVFTDSDRSLMRSEGLEVGDTADGRLYREFALIYNCLTLPDSSLYMSWCSEGEEGARNQPSFVINRLRDIFALEIHPVDLQRCRASAPAPAFELAAAANGPCPSAAALAAGDYLAAHGRAEELQRLKEAAALTRGRLSRSSVRTLYGDRLRLSASRIDKLSACSFGYFMQYGLRARPRQAADFAAPEMGSFMHYVLEHVASDISASGGFRAVEPERVDELADKYVEQYIHEKLNDFREKSPRFIYLFRRLMKNVRSVVADMAAELRKSDFVPLDFELNFGDAASFRPIELGQGDDALVLTGIADRVDGWLHDGKLYVRVVDYKTGRKSFSLSDVYYGMGLQMLLYLFALEREGGERYGHEIVPAGVLYVPARDVLVSAPADLSPEKIAALKAKSRRRSGLVLDDDAVIAAMENGDEPCYIPVNVKSGSYSGDALASLERLGQLSRHIDRTLRDMAGELRGGSIAADPYYRSQTENACAFCDYAQACHFDEEHDCIRYQTRLPAARVWEELGKGGGD